MKSQQPRILHVEAAIAPAAELQNRSISDSGMAAAAQENFAEVEVFRLSREGQEQVTALLLDPPPVSDALLRAIERHRTLMAG